LMLLHHNRTVLMLKRTTTIIPMLIVMMILDPSMKLPTMMKVIPTETIKKMTVMMTKILDPSMELQPVLKQMPMPILMISSDPSTKHQRRRNQSKTVPMLTHLTRQKIRYRKMNLLWTQTSLVMPSLISLVSKHPKKILTQKKPGKRQRK